jgi:hypothetical protein
MSEWQMDGYPDYLLHGHGRRNVESSMNSVNLELPCSTTSTPPPVTTKTKKEG